MLCIASLNTARGKSRDAAIKSQMGELRKAAELYQLMHGAYGSIARGQDSVGECSGGSSSMNNSMFGPNASDDNVTRLVTAVHDKSSQTGGGSRVYCAVGNSPDSWAFAAPLGNPEGSNEGWCVDSSGSSKDFNLNNMSAANSGILRSGNAALCP